MSQDSRQASEGGGARERAIERGAWALWEEIGDGLSEQTSLETLKLITEKILQAACMVSLPTVAKPEQVQLLESVSWPVEQQSFCQTVDPAKIQILP